VLSTVVGDDESDRGMGVALPIILIGCLIAAGAFLVVRRRAGPTASSRAS
jgi:hypothetical protein